MPPSSRISRALIKLPIKLFSWLLCAVLVLGVPPHALAAKAATPKPTKLPQPTRDPAAESYDDMRPELLVPDQLIATAAILIERKSGEVVFEKNADEVLYPASTTKIMTALLTVQSMEYDELPEEVEVSDIAVDQPEDSSLIPVVAGEAVNEKDLLYGMMLRSGNEAAAALAEHVAGTQEAFVERMNEAAEFYGCTNTHFVNPHGYHDPDHYTTARDLSAIARVAMDFDLFRDVVSTEEYLMPATNKHPARRLITNDTFIRKSDAENDYYYPDAIGIKTGFHSAAMYCFVAAAERDGVELISVVLYTSDRGRWVDTRRLMEYGFKQYESITVEELYALSPREINIGGFDLSDAKDRGHLKLGIRPVDEERKVTIVGRADYIQSIKNDFSTLAQIRITRSERAPVTQGEVMGYLTFTPDDGPPAEYELIATRSIEARKDAPLSLEEIQAYTLADPNLLPRFSLEFLVVPLSLLLIGMALFRLLRGQRQRRHSRKQKKRIPEPKTRSYR